MPCWIDKEGRWSLHACLLGSERRWRTEGGEEQILDKEEQVVEEWRRRVGGMRKRKENGEWWKGRMKGWM